MKRFGSELEFISRILRDGSGVEPVDQKFIKNEWTQKETFELNRLSITQGTYIASSMNCYVVKLKNPPPEKQRCND